MENGDDLQEQLDSLVNFFRGKRVIIAFSGGVDSSLLAYLARENADDVLLVTETSPLYPEEESQESKAFAEKYHIPHMFLERDPYDDDNFLQNSPDRCYFCKKGLYEDILRLNEELGFDIIVDGSNYDDLNDVRPGMNAVKELGISTPYLDFQIRKVDIRQMSEMFDLPTQKKPSMACLSSRVSYSQRITPEIIQQIKSAEQYLRNQYSIPQLRVRAHPDKLARIEIRSEDWPKILDPAILVDIAKKLKTFGFCYVTLDIEGFRSGSMNEILKNK
jgi:uncharacterized protein